MDEPAEISPGVFDLLGFIWASSEIAQHQIDSLGGRLSNLEKMARTAGEVKEVREEHLSNQVVPPTVTPALFQLEKKISDLKELVEKGKEECLLATETSRMSLNVEILQLRAEVRRDSESLRKLRHDFVLPTIPPKNNTLLD